MSQNETNHILVEALFRVFRVPLQIRLLPHRLVDERTGLASPTSSVALWSSSSTSRPTPRTRTSRPSPRSCSSRRELSSSGSRTPVRRWVSSSRSLLFPSKFTYWLISFLFRPEKCTKTSLRWKASRNLCARPVATFNVNDANSYSNDIMNWLSISRRNATRTTRRDKPMTTR